MPIQIKNEIQLEIAHVLFIDIVGYSKLSISDQHAAVEELNRIVRASEQFQRAEAANRLIRIPTGDGMVLVFYTNPEAPAQCRQSFVLSAEAELDPKTSPHHSRNPAGPIRGGYFWLMLGGFSESARDNSREDDSASGLHLPWPS